MVRKRLELRREEILAAAAAEIRRQGIGTTRVVDVARSLGVSSGLIFYHFDTKERLLSETFAFAAERDLDRLEQVLARRGPAMARLWAVLDLYAPTGDASGWVLWIDGWAAALRDDALRTVLRRLDSRWRQAVGDLIRVAVAEGGLTCDDPDGSAARITALVDGLAVQRVVRRDTLPATHLRAWVREYVACEIGIAGPSRNAD